MRPLWDALSYVLLVGYCDTSNLGINGSCVLFIFSKKSEDKIILDYLTDRNSKKTERAKEYYYLGIKYEQKRKYDKVIECFPKKIERYPDYADT